MNCANQQDNCLHFGRANIDEVNSQNQQLAARARKLASTNIIRALMCVQSEPLVDI
jgi:hypothetical protein